MKRSHCKRNSLGRKTDCAAKLFEPTRCKTFFEFLRSVLGEDNFWISQRGFLPTSPLKPIRSSPNNFVVIKAIAWHGTAGKDPDTEQLGHFSSQVVSCACNARPVAIDMAEMYNGDHQEEARVLGVSCGSSHSIALLGEWRSACMRYEMSHEAKHGRDRAQNADRLARVATRMQLMFYKHALSTCRLRCSCFMGSR